MHCSHHDFFVRSTQSHTILWVEEALRIQGIKSNRIRKEPELRQVNTHCAQQRTKSMSIPNSSLQVGASQPIQSRHISGMPWSRRLFCRKSPEPQIADAPIRRELRVLIVGDSSNDELL